MNGRIEYSTTAPFIEGTEARHICNPGFILVGNVIRVCQSSGSFNRSIPTCECKVEL